jgi:hypothetical protein
MGHIVLSILLSLAPPLTPTYSSCFEAYLSSLQQTNIAEAHGLITHDQARTRRIAAANDYAACKREAFRAWLRERIRQDPTRYD